MSEKIKALLATGRISNLPTVWCNCLAAFLILFHQLGIESEQIIQQPWEKYILEFSIYLVFVSSCFYVGGCFMGDFHDRSFDKKHKPDRPIPAGILSKNLVLVLGMGLMFLAIMGGIFLTEILFFLSIRNHLLPIVFLYGVISLYSLFHKKSLFIGLPLIGLCRFFLIVFGSFAACFYLSQDTHTFFGSTYNEGYDYLTQPIILYASAVCLYTICFASVARTESSDSPITWRNLLRYTMLGLPFVAIISRDEFHGNYLAIAGLIAFAIYALWLVLAFQFLEKNKGAYVSRCLAGFCLLDACFVAQFGWVWFAICIALFGFALLLQRVAPAT